MPLVEFSHPSKAIRISKKMPNPKRLDNLVYWLKLARKTIPEIPAEDNNWRLTATAASMSRVAFQFTNRNEDNCYVKIDRNVTFFG